ncbi:uncharacterized [Tachysurus ichikawai]
MSSSLIWIKRNDFNLVLRTLKEDETLMMLERRMICTDRTRLNQSVGASVSVLCKQSGERGTARRQA